MGIKYFDIIQPTPHNSNVRERIMPAGPAEEMIFSEVSNTLGHLYDGCYGRNWDSVMHGVMNYFFGDGSIDVPAKFLDAEGNPRMISRGREAHTIVVKNGVVRHNHLMTYIMPDGTVHVIMADVTFK